MRENIGRKAGQALGGDSVSLDYDTLVIGTGFGGAVAACRLAQAGCKVAILERGKRYPRDSFPRDWTNPLNGWVWQEKQGLFDVKPVNEMTVVQGAGYGGGSLIYANVHLRLPAEVFDQSWPKDYSRERLDPYYDLVAYMLDIKPITASAFLGLPPKTRMMKQAAESLGRGGQFCYPNLAIDFSAPDKVHQNKFGVEQSGCNYCGQCDIGCNTHAKNTLDLNYLALAERHGAKAFTRCEAMRIEPLPEGFRVLFKNHETEEECSLQSRYVFLCAGAVNSTELLLRCRDEFRTLPNLSSKLGHGYSGNGDFLAFAFQTQAPWEPSNGPTITTGLVYDDAATSNRSWFILQEGGYPREIASLIQLLDPKKDWLSSMGQLLREDLEREIRARLSHVTPSADQSQLDRTAVFLAMGRDRANGEITLTPLTHALRVLWDVPSNLPLYDREQALCADVATALGGVAATNPFWHRLHVPVSVHNLGGCCMGDGPASAVTDSNGEVFGYPGLYVMDGAILPAATGVNPSHTIAAVAERNIEQAIRKIRGQAGWRAPEAEMATKVQDPLSSISIPRGGTPPPRTAPVGLSFTETMKGFIALSFSPADDFVAAERAAQRDKSLADFTLTITIGDLDRFLEDESHPALARGMVHVAGLTGDDGAAVTNGLFNLFVPDGHFYERRMLYALPFVGSDGKKYLLDGYKEVQDHGHFDVWGATSTLYTVIRDGFERSGAVVATGILHIHMPDFLHQLTTFQVSGTNSEVEKASAMARFGKSFMGTLWDVFVRRRFD